MASKLTLDPTELQSVLDEVSRALEDKDAIGIVITDEPFISFIAKTDSGLPAKIAVSLAQESKVLGALFIKKEQDQASGRYHMFQKYKHDQRSNELVRGALDEILSIPDGGTKSELLNLSKVLAILEGNLAPKRADGNSAPKHGTRSLGDLTGYDAQKLTGELRDLSARLTADRKAQENALDQPHHLFIYSAVDPDGKTRFFDLMPQTDGISIAETAIGGARLGQCVETVYHKPGGGAHHVHRLYGKFRASTARKAMEDFAGLAGLNQVTEIAETQTQREALPTWRFIFERLGAVPNQDSQAQNKATRESCSKAETNARSERTSKASAKLVQEKVTKEEASDRKSPSGIGGWLAVFVLGLFGNGAMLSFESLNLPLNTSNALGMGMGLCLAALAFSSAILILRKNPRGILLAKVFIGANLFVNILAVIGSIHDSSALGAASAGMGRVLLFSLIWITYLHQSVRVKNTFPSTTAKDQSSRSDASARRGRIRSISTALRNSANGKTAQKTAITLLVLAVATPGVALLVTVVRKHPASGPQLQSETASSEQPKIDQAVLARSAGAINTEPRVRPPTDLSGGLVPNQPGQAVSQQPVDLVAAAQAAGAVPVEPQHAERLTNSQVKDLQESLQWLESATEVESGTGVPPFEAHGFRSDGGCRVRLTESRIIDGKTKDFPPLVFSLTDIEPSDIQVDDLGKGAAGKSLKGEFSVTFHTRNYQDLIEYQDPNQADLRAEHPDWFRSKEVILITNGWFAPRFAKALSHAAKLCGGKPSSF